MPIYEYACGACGHQFELTQRITEDAISECPECGKPEATRLISATAFQLKGSGWYKTDYGSSGGSNGTSAPSKTDSSNKTPAKADTKASEKKAAGDKASKEKSSTAKTSGSDSKPTFTGKKKQSGKKS